MKMRSKMTSFLAALSFGAVLLAGSVIPSLAQTTTAQPQALVQTAQPTTAYGGWYGPTMWWPATSGNPGTASSAQQGIVPQPVGFWGCWGGWW